MGHLSAFGCGVLVSTSNSPKHAIKPSVNYLSPCLHKFPFVFRTAKTLTVCCGVAIIAPCDSAASLTSHSPKQ